MFVKNSAVDFKRVRIEFDYPELWRNSASYYCAMKVPVSSEKLKMIPNECGKNYLGIEVDEDPNPLWKPLLKSRKENLRKAATKASIRLARGRRDNA
ncbi:MAG: hypothetical protein ACI9HK_001287 [Pirellulaceae bacterium]|jgi:hypothetical protein